MLAGLLAVFVAGAPFAGLAAGSWAYAAAARDAQAQQAISHPLQATLLQPAMQWGIGGYRFDVPARWKAPDGQFRTGEVSAPTGTQAGSTVTIWVDRAGQLTAAPLQPGQIAGRVHVVEVLAAIALALGLIAVGVAGHSALNRRRLAAWGTEWRATGPRWSPGGRTPSGGD